MPRPPPASGSASFRESSDGSGSARPGIPKRGLEWSLRSMHKIDTSAQHFLSNYSDPDMDDGMMNGNGDKSTAMTVMEDQTAFDIFKTADVSVQSLGPKNGNGGGYGNTRQDDKVWAALHAPLRVGIVDGKKVVFELLTNVTQRPVTSRQDRVSRHIEIVNASRSSWEARFRFWLMHFNLLNLSLSFLAVYVALNVIFAGLFFIDDDKCCGNPDTTFGEVFAFCVQTSATIGYGAMAPSGAVSNFLVLMLSFLATLISTLFAGLLFTKFVTPVVKIQFADVMTLCNVNGVPCLTVRIGNADGYENRLTDINVRLSYSYQIPYVDHKGEKRTFGQTDELKLLSSRQHGLLECWHLRHVVDENSPLFGLNFEEHPANKIHLFTLSVDAVQNLTKSSVNVQTEYALEDILIGHNFKPLDVFDEESHRYVSDYSLMSETDPYPVWYPAKTGVHDTEEKVPPRSFGAH